MSKHLLGVWLIAATVIVTAGLAHSQETPDWTRPFPAFKLIGNVYWVGTYCDPNRFVDPKGYLAAVDTTEQRFKAQLSKERAGQ